jgi:hypothetical protein
VVTVLSITAYTIPVSCGTDNGQRLFLETASANEFVIKAQYVSCDAGIEM